MITTVDFIQEVRELGFNVDTDSTKYIKIASHDETLIYIHKLYQNNINIISIDNPTLMNLVLEYAQTPIDLRESGKQVDSKGEHKRNILDTYAVVALSTKHRVLYVKSYKQINMHHNYEITLTQYIDDATRFRKEPFQYSKELKRVARYINGEIKEIKVFESI